MNRFLKNMNPISVQRLATAVGVGLIVIAASSHGAFAGTDTTFDSLTNQFGGYVQGSGGKLAAVLALGAALAGSVLRFNLAQMVGAIGVGAVAGFGVPIVTAGVTALV